MNLTTFQMNYWCDTESFGIPIGEFICYNHTIQNDFESFSKNSFGEYTKNNKDSLTNLTV